MRIEQIYHIIEVAKLHSISKASEKLNISQPALSSSIKSLESELGITIFKRTSKGVFLTAEGKRISDEGEVVVKIIEGWNHKNINDSEPSGEIHIICSPVISHYITPKIIVPFQKEYENLTVFVHGVQHYAIINKILSTSANIAIATSPPKTHLLAQAKAAQLDAVLLSTDERRLFMGATHPLASKESLTLEDLKGTCLAWYSDPRDMVSRVYIPYFASSFRLANKEDILELVIQNIAVFVQPRNLFKLDYRVKEKIIVEKEIPIPEIDSKCNIYAFSNRSRSRNEELFWDYLIENF